MPSPTDLPESVPDAALSAAGQRAARRPVMIGPPLDTIEQRARRLRSRRRVLSASAVLVLLAGLAVPLNFALRSEAPVQMVAAGGSTGADGGIPPASAAAQPPNSGDGDAAETPEPGDDRHSGRLELRLGSDIEIAVTALAGPDAVAAAAAAEERAVETRDVNGTTVWVLDAGDDRTTIAAAIDDGYIEVSGPSERLEELLAIIEDGELAWPEIGRLPFPDFERFGEGGPFGFDHEFDFGFDGEFPFDFDDTELEEFLERLPERFGPDGPFRFDFDNDGEFPFELDHTELERFLDGLRERIEGFDGEFPGEHGFGFFFGGPGEDGRFPFDFDDTEGRLPFPDVEELNLCFRLQLGGDEPFVFEHPEGCSEG